MQKGAHLGVHPSFLCVILFPFLLQRVDLSLRDQLHAVCGQARGDLLRIHLVRGQTDDQQGIAVEVIVKGQLKSQAAVKSL